ncbi:MAG: hypothetical protein KatS3mg105_3382 [Gemmatales bacterium]|nr:MAG: hypothetical protein KatS3mg105_3382 [Gemmatales bacterium]
MKRCCPALCLFVFLSVATSASAHYPWFVIVSKGGKQGTLRLYFEEGPRPGPGEFLDPFFKGKCWLRTPSGESQIIRLNDEKQGKQRWASANVDTPKPRAVECFAKWGVYKGKLLFYYAKLIDVETTNDLVKIGQAQNLAFDLVPRMKDNMVEVAVLWKGKPKAGVPVTVAGPGFRRTRLTANDQGIVRFEPAGKGLYTVMSMFIEPDPAGEDDGKKYQGLRQTATLTINLPVK